MKSRPKHILLIDDDDDDREIFENALSNVDASIKCSALDNAREALSLLTDKALDPDLIFLDLNMPVMTGQQFLLEIKKREALKDIPVIIFSTSSHPATIETTKQLGAHDFYSKPNTFEDLVTLVRSVVD